MSDSSQPKSYPFPPYIDGNGGVDMTNRQNTGPVASQADINPVDRSIPAPNAPNFSVGGSHTLNDYSSHSQRRSLQMFRVAHFATSDVTVGWPERLPSPAYQLCIKALMVGLGALP
ncbi:hypothetical protein H4R33_006935 [Dimargaris cristalligena]|nr:hypothetical protein H4R33_006935 [Dimargaris cristalligena]